MVSSYPNSLLVGMSAINFYLENVSDTVVINETPINFLLYIESASLLFLARKAAQELQCLILKWTLESSGAQNWYKPQVGMADSKYSQKQAGYRDKLNVWALCLIERTCLNELGGKYWRVIYNTIFRSFTCANAPSRGCLYIFNHAHTHAHHKPIHMEKAKRICLKLRNTDLILFF